MFLLGGVNHIFDHPDLQVILFMSLVRFTGNSIHVSHPLPRNCMQSTKLLVRLDTWTSSYSRVHIFDLALYSAKEPCVQAPWY